MNFNLFSAVRFRSLSASIAFSLFSLSLLFSFFVVSPTHAAPYPTPFPAPTPSIDPINRFWDKGTPITGGQLLAPTNNLQVAPGATVNCAVAAAADIDHWRTQWSPNGDEADRILYNWTQGGSDNGFSTPGYASTTWTAPTTPGTYTLTCTIYDDATIPQNDEQGGVSNPSSSRTDAPVVRTVNVVVGTNQVTLSSKDNKTSVVAGSVNTPVHQIELTATVKSSNDMALSNKNVTFSVANVVATDLDDEKVRSVRVLERSTTTVPSPKQPRATARRK